MSGYIIDVTITRVMNLIKETRLFSYCGCICRVFLWHKEFLMPESEKQIYLENTHRNPLSDDDLAQRLKVKLLGDGKLNIRFSYEDSFPDPQYPVSLVVRPIVTL